MLSQETNKSIEFENEEKTYSSENSNILEVLKKVETSCLEDGTLEITKYTGSVRNIEIPRMIN